MKLLKNNTLKTKAYKLDEKTPDATTLIHINQYNTEKQNLENKIVYVYQKIPGVSASVDTTDLIVESKVPDLSGLAKKTDYEAKILEMDERYFISSDYNKFTSDIVDTKI